MDDYSNMSNIERNGGTSRARGRISEVSDAYYLHIISIYSLLYYLYADISAKSY